MKALNRKRRGMRRTRLTTQPTGFALEIRVRGRADLLHQDVCEGLEDAIQIGEKWFRAFERRNPWFVQDSRRKRILILLDPETQVLLQAVTPG